MPTWGQIESEILKTRDAQGRPDFDGVRRKYMRKLAEYTGRSCIVYETAGLAPPPQALPRDIQISLDPDMGAFMEAVHGLPKDKPLDLILHSPGGTAEAAEAIISYLRGRFPGLRVIVPIAAMSAATMMAMASDEIVMGGHSQLGPIDPQLTIATPEGPRTAPAAAIQQQFVEAQEDLAKNPAHTAAWLPILRSMSPALLQICRNAEQLSKTIVSGWLQQYMFNSDSESQAKAKAVTEFLSDYDQFMSHGRRVDRQALRSLDVKVTDLEADEQLQDLVLSVHHAINHAMNLAGLTKIVENNLGRAFIRRVQVQLQVVGPPTPLGAQPGQQPGIPAPTQPGSRQQRRAAERGQRKGRK